MKMIFVTGAVALLASLFCCQVYAIELCEPQDYYQLANSTKCKIKSNEAGNKGDSQAAMFEIMKNYPFENKDEIAKLLQRKVELIDTYKTQQQSQGQGQAEKVKAAVSKLEQTRQDLLAQEGLVNASTRDTWVSVRDQARKSLEEATRRLRDVE